MNVRRCLSILLFFGLTAVQALAQETPQETAALDRVGPWKVINTAIFLVLLGWFLAKKGPAFFNARSADIQKAIQDATGLKMHADLRYSEIDRRMAALSEEVEKVREQARKEFEREHQRLLEQTADEIARIQRSAAKEVEALRDESAKGIQQHTASLALGLAEKRLQDQFAKGEPKDLLDEFIHLVERGKN